MGTAKQIPSIDKHDGSITLQVFGGQSTRTISAHVPYCLVPECTIEYVVDTLRKTMRGLPLRNFDYRWSRRTCDLNLWIEIPLTSLVPITEYLKRFKDGLRSTGFCINPYMNQVR